MGVHQEAIRLPRPFRFHESLLRFQHSSDERVNRYDGAVFRRLLLDGKGGKFLLEAEGSGPRARVVMRLRAPGRLSRMAISVGEASLRHILALDLEMAPFYRMAEEDAVLKPIVRRFCGLRPVRYLSVFEALVTAITAQQVNLTFAGVIRRRLVERWGERMDIGGERHFAFPRPERLARAWEATLRNMQFSGRKAQYVIGVARAAAGGLLDADELRRLPLEEAIARQVSIRGVGRWTAEQVLFRALGRVEAIPAGDLGVQKVVARYCFGKEKLDEDRVRRRARRWAPWGALAVTYLFAAWRTDMPPATED